MYMYTSSTIKRQHLHDFEFMTFGQSNLGKLFLLASLEGFLPLVTRISFFICCGPPNILKEW
jgi:hypothetical protein